MRAVVAIQSLAENPYFAQKSSQIFDHVDYLSERPGEAELRRVLTSYEAVIIGARERISGAMLDGVALKTQLIGTLSVGTDHLDMGALASRGVHVERCPTANVRSVAEHALTLLLALAKRVKQGDRLVAEGKSRRDLPALPREVEGKTLGLVGFGNIGRLVADLGHAFGLNVIATSPSHRSGSDGFVSFHTFEDVLGRSDLLSISVPLTAETEQFINSASLGLLKEGAIIVNTSRREVVVESAISAALDAGRLAGYGGDYDGADRALAGRDDVLLTPHVAGITVESNDRLDNELVDRLAVYLAGRGRS